MVPLLLVVGATAFSLLFVEGLARLKEIARSDYLKPIILSQKPVQDIMYRSSDVLGWEHVPGVMGVNRLGFRNPYYPVKKANGVLRTLLIGDSLAEAYGKPLSEIIQAEGRSDQQWELWNLGVAGYNIHQYANLLPSGLQYNPDHVVVFFCLNDLQTHIPLLHKSDSGLVVLRWRRQSVRLPLSGIFWERSALYRMLAARYLKKVEAKHNEVPTMSREAASDIQLGRIQDATKNKGIPLVAFIFPYLKPLSEYTRKEMENYELLKKLLDSRQIRYFDLHGKMDEASLVSKRVVPGDQIHFSEAAAYEPMQIVYSQLRSELGFSRRSGKDL